MYEEAVKKLGPIGAARKTALMTQSDLAERLGCSVPVIVDLEKNPQKITLEQLGQVYNSVRTDGKAIIEQFVSEFFIA